LILVNKKNNLINANYGNKGNICSKLKCIKIEEFIIHNSKKDKSIERLNNFPDNSLNSKNIKFFIVKNISNFSIISNTFKNIYNSFTFKYLKINKIINFSFINSYYKMNMKLNNNINKEEKFI
jgi:hypothetical protein